MTHQNVTNISSLDKAPCEGDIGGVWFVDQLKVKLGLNLFKIQNSLEFVFRKSNIL